MEQLSLITLILFFPILFIYLYYKSKVSLITIQFAGGEIAFDIRWFSQQEIADFQRQLRLAKDMAVEDVNNAVADKFTQAISSMQFKQNQSPQINIGDELTKCANLLQQGLITKEEYETVKRRLLS